MVTSNTLGAIIIGLVVLSPSYADDADSAGNLRAAMIADIEPQVADEIGRQLQDSGMAGSDVQRTINDLAKTMTDCTIDALVQLAEEQSIDAVTLLAETETTILENDSKDFGKGLDEGRLKEKMNYCFLIAFENAGLKAPQIAP